MHHREAMAEARKRSKARGEAAGSWVAALVLNYDLYTALVAAGIPTDSHESDLYCLSTPKSRALVELSGKNFNRFTRQVDGKAWLDVPFAFTPFWDKMRARVAPLTAHQQEGK